MCIYGLRLQGLGWLAEDGAFEVVRLDVVPTVVVGQTIYSTYLYISDGYSSWVSCTKVMLARYWYNYLCSYTVHILPT